MQVRIEELTSWIREQVPEGGKAIIGISGGKDSTIAAALCVKALGAENVIGVLMPNGGQADIGDSNEVCSLLDIRALQINIRKAFGCICDQIDYNYNYTLGSTAKEPMVKTNLPARIRMATLYAVAALYHNSRVVNTCNYSEDYVGYSTKYGDAAGDFSPLGNLTVREVLAIGDALGLPAHLVHKAPSDGMCGKTDEDNLGFTYNELDDYIDDNLLNVSEEVRKKIEYLHRTTRHKYRSMPTFNERIYGDIEKRNDFDFSLMPFKKENNE